MNPLKKEGTACYRVYTAMPPFFLGGLAAAPDIVGTPDVFAELRVVRRDGVTGGSSTVTCSV